MIQRKRSRIAIVCWLIALISLAFLLSGCAGQLNSSHLNGVYEWKTILIVADECNGPAGYYKNLGDGTCLICVSTSDYKNFDMIMQHEQAHAIVDALGLPQPNHLLKLNKYTGMLEK